MFHSLRLRLRDFSRRFFDRAKPREQVVDVMASVLGARIQHSSFVVGGKARREDRAGRKKWEICSMRVAEHGSCAEARASALPRASRGRAKACRASMPSPLAIRLGPRLEAPISLFLIVRLLEPSLTRNIGNRQYMRKGNFLHMYRL
jgi:hypothetical protein